jgi:hypothetical protein
VFPALFDWVSYPVTLFMDVLYRLEMEAAGRDELPCPYRLELLASLERTLCFCHTGSAAVLATSLMRPLGLSRGLVTDGFPVLFKTCAEMTFTAAMEAGFKVKPSKWPTKDGYPAVASKRTQELTYSHSHFAVSPLFTHPPSHFRSDARPFSHLGFRRAIWGAASAPVFPPRFSSRHLGCCIRARFPTSVFVA